MKEKPTHCEVAPRQYNIIDSFFFQWSHNSVQLFWYRSNYIQTFLILLTWHTSLCQDIQNMEFLKTAKNNNKDNNMMTFRPTVTTQCLQWHTNACSVSVLRSSWLSSLLWLSFTSFVIFFHIYVYLLFLLSNFVPSILLVPAEGIFSYYSLKFFQSHVGR